MVGASRERVNKAIALFVKLGWLEISGRSRYRIVNREELEIRSTFSLCDSSRRQRLAMRDELAPASARIAERQLRARRITSRRPTERAPAGARRRRGGRRGRGRGRSRARPLRRRRSRNRCARSRPPAALRCRPRASTDRCAPKNASVGAISAATDKRIDAVAGPAPRVGRAHHAVERDRRVEPVDRRGLEHVVPAHAEAEHRDARDVVFDHEQIGGRGEHVHLLRVVEILDVGKPRFDRRPHRCRLPGERLDRHTPRARAWRGGGPCPRTAGAARRCRDAARARRSACRRAGRARPRPRGRRRRSGHGLDSDVVDRAFAQCCHAAEATADA